MITVVNNAYINAWSVVDLMRKIKEEDSNWENRFGIGRCPVSGLLCRQVSGTYDAHRAALPASLFAKFKSHREGLEVCQEKMPELRVSSELRGFFGSDHRMHIQFRDSA